MAISNHITEDTLFDGKIFCRQHRDGYRFSIDSVLLSHFTGIKKDDCVLDLGTGNGVISLILLYRYFSFIKSLTAVELQEELVNLAATNFKSNGFEEKAGVVHVDVQQIRKHFSPEQYDVVVCNPPFYPKNSGRKTENFEARIARHQINGSLEDFLKATFFVLKNRGAAYFIYPAEQIVHLTCLSTELKLSVKKIRFVYSYQQTVAPASLALIKCVKNGGVDTEIVPPLYIYEGKNEEFTQEVKSFYAPNEIS